MIMIQIIILMIITIIVMMRHSELKQTTHEHT